MQLSDYLRIRSVNYGMVLNYFIVLYAFCLPISRAGVSFSIIVLMLFWLLEGDFKRKYQEIKNSYFILSISIFILYSVVAILWSDDKLFAMDYVKKYYHFLLIPVILTSLKREYIERVFSAFLLGMLISEITSYGIFFEIWTIKGVLPTDPSPFMSHINYSIYLAFTIYILAHKLIYTKELKWKISYSIFFILSTTNLFLNGGRTGQLAFIITLILFGFLNIKNKLKAFISMILLATFILLTAYNVSPVFKDRFDYLIHDIEGMIYENNYSNSFSLRVALWRTGIEASKEAVVFGTGIGDEMLNAKKGIERFSIPDAFGSEHTENYIDYHNAFVQYLVQLGVVGLILFLLIFYFLLKLEIKDKIYKNLLYIFSILFLLQSMQGLTFHIQKSMILFVLFSSLFLVIKKFEEESKGPKNAKA